MKNVKCARLAFSVHCSDDTRILKGLKRLTIIDDIIDSCIVIYCRNIKASVRFIAFRNRLDINIKIILMIFTCNVYTSSKVKLVQMRGISDYNL